MLLDRRSFNMICLRPLKLVMCYLRTCNARSESVHQIKNRYPATGGNRGAILSLGLLNREPLLQLRQDRRTAESAKHADSYTESPEQRVA